MKQKLIFTAVIIAAMVTSCGNKQEEKPNNETQKIEKEKTMKKVLFVLTSHSDLGNTGEKTGFWIEEFAAHYYLLKVSRSGIAIH